MDFHEVFCADYETGRLFWRNPPKNHAQRVGDEAGYPCIGKGKNKTYWQVRAFGRTFKRARVIFYMAHGRWPSPMVDHINGDALDDRLANLRECTAAQNTCNAKSRRRKHELPQGVYRTAQGRFMGRITQDGKTVSVGTYDTPEQAKAAYQRARQEAFGDFAI